MPHPELLFFFFLVAFIYSAVGFGGGSGYLAILALYGVGRAEMKLTALVCNIIVVLGGTILFVRRGELPYKKVIPLVVASVPAAFIGARMKVSDATFFILLGVTLMTAGLLLWLQPRSAEDEVPANNNTIREVATGGGIGFLSGMVSIGGGIFLAPVLHLLRWDTARHIAATASFFILINSIAGLAGQLSVQVQDAPWQQIAMLGGAVLLGGQLGGRMGIAWLSGVLVRRLTAVLVFVAGVEVLMKHFHR